MLAEPVNVSNNPQSSEEYRFNITGHGVSKHYSITNIVRLFKIICISWEEHVVNMRGMCVYSYITEVHLCRKTYLAGLMCIGQNNIKKDLKVIACCLFYGLSCPHTYVFLVMLPVLEND